MTHKDKTPLAGGASQSDGADRFGSNCTPLALELHEAVAYSRGYGQYDNTPEQRVAEGFSEFMNAVLSDRGTAKGQQWIAGPCLHAPDDPLHQAQFAKAIGRPHRCAQCVQPRRFIAHDVDTGLSAESFAMLVQVLHCYSGAVYTTASHTPEAPRCRVVLELDMPAPREVLIAATRAMRGRIDTAMSNAGHGPITWDESCDRPEQPLYLPVQSSQVYRLEGEPLILAELAAEVPDRGPRTEAQWGGVVVSVDRHGDLLTLAAKLARQVHFEGLGEEAALSALHAEAARGRWTREMPASEIRGAFGGALAKCRTGQWRKAGEPDRALSPPPSLVHVDISDIMRAKLPPPGFVFDVIIPRRVVTLLGGHGGMGKSMLGLTLCAHAACGRPWGPFTVDPIRTAYVSLEDAADVVRYRLRRIIEAYGLPADEVIGRLSIFDGTDAEAALVTEVSEAGTRRLSRTPMLGQVTEAVAGAGLVLVDNASDAFDGDENNRRQVRTFVRYLAQIARANDAGMVLLAHIDKNAAKFGGKGNTYSGSTAWHNSARSRLALVEEEGALELLHEKAQFGPVADSLPLVRGDYGILTPGASDPQAREAATDLVARADAEAVFKVMELAASADIIVSTSKTGPQTTWHALSDFPELPSVYRTAAGKRRVSAALLRLEREGRISRESYLKPNRHLGERWQLAQDQQQRAA